MGFCASPPVIGFPLDHEAAGGYSKLPWYALRENYFTAVGELGAAAIGMPHAREHAERYLEMIDALVLTGGHFDIPPSLYGAGAQHETVTLKETRTAFEWAMTEGALRRGIPILGICGGEQLLNVVLGGTLHQHVPEAFPGGLAHEQPNPRHEPGHKVCVTPGTLLHRIVGAEEIAVNSAHHQAVDKPGQGVAVNAAAPDGVIEGIELAEHPFCLGVQWHPEYHVSGADRKIFEALVAACAKT